MLTCLAKLTIPRGYAAGTQRRPEKNRTSTDRHCRKICRRCQLAGVVFAQWPVIGLNGKILSPIASQEWKSRCLGQNYHHRKLSRSTVKHPTPRLMFSIRAMLRHYSEYLTVLQSMHQHRCRDDNEQQTRYHRECLQVLRRRPRHDSTSASL